MKRLDVWLVNLDTTIGSEIKKTRPAVIVSPDELNSHLNREFVICWLVVIVRRIRFQAFSQHNHVHTWGAKP